MKRKHLLARPDLEGLETRALLSGTRGQLFLPNGQPINDADHTRLALQIKAAGLDPQNLKYRQTTSKVLPTIPERRKAFTMPDGTRVTLTLYGTGTLKGTTQDVDGALNIRYDDTNSSSRLISRINSGRPGASGRVLLRSVRDADVPVESLSGVGSNQIGIVNLANFDLLPGGNVNLSGGVQIVQLGVIGPNTIMNIQSLPVSTTPPVDNVLVPSITYVTTPGGGTEIAGVGGLIVPGAVSGAGTQSNTTTSGKVLVEGTSILVDRVDGASDGGDLQPAQIFGYDPTTQQLIRFDTATGAALQTIPIAATPPADGDVGVGLARVGGDLVVLAGIGTTVYAFDGITGNPVGAFTTASLTSGPQVITGIAHTDAKTILVSSVNQTAQVVDVAASLVSGSAVGLGSVFTPSSNPDFILSGAATGVAGVSTAVLTGAQFFTPYSPLNPLPQFGVLKASVNGNNISQSSTIAVGQPSVTGSYALGSVGIFPALVTAVVPASGSTAAHNVVTTYDARTESRSGSFNLFWPNQLTGLSESLHPELDNSAIINMAGIMTRFHARQVNGLVLDGIGYLNTIEVESMSNSTIIGQPIGHLAINQRQNVTAISSDNRPVGDQNGVTIVPNLKPVGPLSPPRLPRI